MAQMMRSVSVISVLFMGGAIAVGGLLSLINIGTDSAIAPLLFRGHADEAQKVLLTVVGIEVFRPVHHYRSTTAVALPNGVIVIEGFTDASGSDDYNFALSKRRAYSVVRYLAEQGVDASKLKARGYGKMRPRTSDPYDPANRRVEVRWSIE